MKILYGSALGLALRELCDSAKQRVWIVSPFIGRWPAVSSLVGANWWLSGTVLLRVITDIDDPARVNRGTLTRLMDRGDVATLPGVHAKIYIVDNRAIIGSANLTETAFTKRHEIAILLDETEAKDVITIFTTWWDKSARIISLDKVDKWPKESEFAAEKEGTQLPALWSLPAKPSDSIFIASNKQASDFAGYRDFLKAYGELSQKYTFVQRLWPDRPLFIETDCFLNYLFHEADGKPAFEFYDKTAPRKLSSEQRESELSKWAPKFSAWVKTTHDEVYRFKNAEIVQQLLAKDRIDTLSRDEIRQVVDCLHCMGSLKLIRHKFLNPANNETDDIRAAWKRLIHGKEKPELRMRECSERLKFFGTSSVQELLGWYYPNQFPIRNSNSDAGLRFFGYRV